MNTKKIRTLLFVVILFSLVVSQENLVNSDLVRDYWPTNGWLTSSLREANLNQSRIDDMFEYIEGNNFDIDSILVIKEGNLTIEEYFTEDYTKTDLHSVFSVTKSVSSALIGIAIEEGYIESVDQKILDFFQDVNVLNKTNKENITIEHLLTHTSGVYWREDQLPYSSPDNSFNLMTDSPNWVEFLLNLSMENEPGTVRNYNSGDSHLLSAILTNATGTSTYLYAKEHLFDPLGIENLIWSQDPQGICFGGSGLRLRPRSMAKFGYLYLNNGTWDQEQLISKEWVLNSTKAHVVIDDWRSYGYQWYVYPQVNSYVALGYQQQIIWINPEYDLVIVFTSTISEGIWPYGI
ncbi:MAG: serine hydrolase domain-containing protein, partial [Candidatus Heimdallarchaeaceae archaeon]